MRKAYIQYCTYDIFGGRHRPKPLWGERRRELALFHHVVIPRRTLMLPGSRSVVALALTSSLVKATTSYSGRRAQIILRNGSTSAYSASASEYELLKKSRPFRIRARLIPPTNERRSNIVGSAETTKIVHFQRHAQGTQLFGRSAFCFNHGMVFPSRQSRHITLWFG